MRRFQLAKNAAAKSAAEEERVRREQAERQAADAAQKQAEEAAAADAARRRDQRSRRPRARGGAAGSGPADIVVSRLGASDVRLAGRSFHNRFIDESQTIILGGEAAAIARSEERRGSADDHDASMQAGENSDGSDSGEENGGPALSDFGPHAPIAFAPVESRPAASQEPGQVVIKTEPSESPAAMEVDGADPEAEAHAHMFGDLAELLLPDGNGQMYIFQLPLQLPEPLTARGSPAASAAGSPAVPATLVPGAATEEPPVAVKAEDPHTSPASTTVLSSAPASSPLTAAGIELPGDWRAGQLSTSGLVGHLDFLDDGTVQLSLGDTVFDAFSGARLSMLQHLAVIDEGSKAAHLSAPLSAGLSPGGERPSRRIVCMPQM